MVAWDNNENDFTHYNEVNDISHVSTIDHLMWDAQFDPYVTDTGVIHHPDNMSDHSPIFCKFYINHTSETKILQLKPPVKPNWKKSSEIERVTFKIKLNYLLNDISVPDCVNNCHELHCKDLEHTKAADEYMIDILDCIELAASQCLHHPPTKKMHKKSIPGWSESVRPLKEKAFFWYQVWQSAGRPLIVFFIQL